MTTETILPGPTRPGILRQVRAWWGPHALSQGLFIAALGLLVIVLASNTLATMTRIGITPGFDFLWRSANFEIGEGLIPFRAGDPYFRAILVGLLNTIKVAALGCVFATILGVILGVAGLSGNLLLATLVRWYIEAIRNTPLLLQLFFWIALAKSFPPPRAAISAFDSVFLTNRGVFVPTVNLVEASAWTWWLIIAIVAALVAGLSWLRRGHGLTLSRFGVLFVAGLVAIAIVLLLSDGRFSAELPVLAGFNIRGGASLTPEFAALLTGLTVKFSAAIAEIVRAGIQSVSQGQWEAARTLGLRDGQIMRLIVLPQALRVITPLTTSSYLDLTKDSSLAVAIGYPDLVNVINTTANTTGQSFEALAILIGLYLTLNLTVSAAMNLYNRRVALRGQAR
ncbi:amino acid ABC transporter permease [Tianweitania populi]|uniref:Amino acid ABC transporter permease n=1 Tax=Tianweitania populi TaxID=1607949 RepID=A0A8J3DV01_9HYPH|nr:ABC transporter permease subunit [Tianweitania populi]GHD23263.1 amino acid ABC transporter permease [Tianweitania populi]